MTRSHTRFTKWSRRRKLPVIFHTGHSGIGTGMPGGGGIRLKYGNPMDMDDVAVDFPDMPIILAHPSFPWQDEAISVCLHKPQVYIDLSGWSPKYFSPTLIQYANTLLKNKVLFGSDYPLITPDRWMADFAAINQGRSAAADLEGERGAIVWVRVTLTQTGTAREIPRSLGFPFSRLAVAEIRRQSLVCVMMVVDCCEHFAPRPGCSGTLSNAA